MPVVPPHGKDGAAAHVVRIFHNDLVVSQVLARNFMDTVSKDFEKPAATINPPIDPPLQKEKALASAPTSKHPTECENATKDRPFPKRYKRNGPKLPLVSRSTNESESYSNHRTKPTRSKVKKFLKRFRSEAGTNVASLPLKTLWQERESLPVTWY